MKAFLSASALSELSSRDKWDDIIGGIPCDGIVGVAPTMETGLGAE